MISGVGLDVGLGLTVGLVVGETVGLGDTVIVGLIVGDVVGEGLLVGDMVGLMVGETVGLGDVVGLTLGEVVGEALPSISSLVTSTTLLSKNPCTLTLDPEDKVLRSTALHNLVTPPITHVLSGGNTSSAV